MPQVTVTINYAGLRLSVSGDYTAECGEDCAEFECTGLTADTGINLYDAFSGLYNKATVRKPGEGKFTTYTPMLGYLEAKALEALSNE